MSVTKSFSEDVLEKMNDYADTFEDLFAKEFEGMGPGMRQLSDVDFMAWVVAKSSPKYTSPGFNPQTGRIEAMPGTPWWLVAMELTASTGDEFAKSVMDRLDRIRKEGMQDGSTATASVSDRQ